MYIHTHTRTYTIENDEGMDELSGRLQYKQGMARTQTQFQSQSPDLQTRSDPDPQSSKTKPPRKSPNTSRKDPTSELIVRTLSTYAANALSDVADRFYDNKCEVSDLLDSALGADPGVFKKVGGTWLL